MSSVIGHNNYGTYRLYEYFLYYVIIIYLNILIFRIYLTNGIEVLWMHYFLQSAHWNVVSALSKSWLYFLSSMTIN